MTEDDLLERMRRNPQSDWTIKDVEKLCHQYGATCEAPRGGGSHYKVFHRRIDHIQTVPFKRPIKPIYIKLVVRLIDAVRKLQPPNRRNIPSAIRPLDPEDGGGFVAQAPELPGCTSDGATAQEALANLQDAITCWIEAATDMGRPIPKPHSYKPQQPEPLKKYG